MNLYYTGEVRLYSTLYKYKHISIYVHDLCFLEVNVGCHADICIMCIML